MTLTYPSIFAILNTYCSPFPVFLKPPVGGEPGARSLPSLLAALISVLFLCVAYINKSINIYELAVEFCIFESSKSPLQDVQNVNDLKKGGII